MTENAGHAPRYCGLIKHGSDVSCLRQMQLRLHDAPLWCFQWGWRSVNTITYITLYYIHTLHHMCSKTSTIALDGYDYRQQPKSVVLRVLVLRVLVLVLHHNLTPKTRVHCHVRLSVIVRVLAIYLVRCCFALTCELRRTTTVCQCMYATKPVANPCNDLGVDLSLKGHF